MSGPAPTDPKLRRRRNASPGFKLLPHEGRTTPPPDWPLPGQASEEEKTYWNRLWKLPQAVEWERMRCEDFVALYVRSFVEASYTGANTKLLGEVRQLDTKLGLSPKAMKDLRWETDEPLPEDEPDDVESGKPVASARTYVPKPNA